MNKYIIILIAALMYGCNNDPTTPTNDWYDRHHLEQQAYHDINTYTICEGPGMHIADLKDFSEQEIVDACNNTSHDPTDYAVCWMSFNNTPIQVVVSNAHNRIHGIFFDDLIAGASTLCTNVMSNK